MPPESSFTPAQLGFIAIYNPSLGDEDSPSDQIIYYRSPSSRSRSPKKKSRDREERKKEREEREREERNRQLRRVGLAQGMIGFGRTFSGGEAVESVETERGRVIVRELEEGWWVLVSINSEILVKSTTTNSTFSKTTPGAEVVEYSTRGLKPNISLLGDLLRAHSLFLLHHGSSMGEIFASTKREEFNEMVTRFWDSFVASWDFSMHGNPANRLYDGIKIAGSGELGVGVGEEESGSGEREVLEGFQERLEGLVDLMVGKFGSPDTGTCCEGEQEVSQQPGPWLGTGKDPDVEDGIIFMGIGGLSRSGLKDISHLMEDIYRWGDRAYGIEAKEAPDKEVKNEEPLASLILTIDGRQFRVIIYANRPFIFAFIFNPEAEPPTNLQLEALIKPLIRSTAPEEAPSKCSISWDSDLLTLKSTVPNIPDLDSTGSPRLHVKAINLHMQLINTFIATRGTEEEECVSKSKDWVATWSRGENWEISAVSDKDKVLDLHNNPK